MTTYFMVCLDISHLISLCISGQKPNMEFLKTENCMTRKKNNVKSKGTVFALVSAHEMPCGLLITRKPNVWESFYALSFRVAI